MHRNSKYHFAQHTRAMNKSGLYIKCYAAILMFRSVKMSEEKIYQLVLQVTVFLTLIGMFQG